MAMGRSKLGPSFRTSAGARLMVVRPMGNLNPELVSAVLTRSRDSFTAASGSPTITTIVSPQPELTSTSTGKASIPLTAADKTRASMGRDGGRTSAQGQCGFSTGRLSFYEGNSPNSVENLSGNFWPV